MTYIVCIVNNLTKEQRVKAVDLEWNESSYFWWTEGNFGCDCNRQLVWDDWKTDFKLLVCGESKFSIPWVEVEGKRIVIDGADK